MAFSYILYNARMYTKHPAKEKLEIFEHSYNIRKNRRTTEITTPRGLKSWIGPHGVLNHVVLKEDLYCQQWVVLFWTIL